jgi:acetyl esterase/lipase
MKPPTWAVALPSPAAVHLSSLAAPVELPTYMALERPLPDRQVPYGPAAAQAVDVFVPRGPGPHPVAILVHGGCWSVTTAGREQLRHLGAELAARGIAAWSVGYRRANEAGGGYPGTYLDIAAAFDRLREEATLHRLDLARSVAIGHSAGGHLALWAAARAGIASHSPLHGTTPFLPAAVISVAGIGDLQAFSPYIPLICGAGIEDRLHGPAEAFADRYADVSPAALPPPPMPVVLVSSVLDRLVPPHVAHHFAQTLKRNGKDDVELLHVPDAGHFDPVTPGTPAWHGLFQIIAQLVAKPAPTARAAPTEIAPAPAPGPRRAALNADSHDT